MEFFHCSFASHKPLFEFDTVRWPKKSDGTARSDSVELLGPRQIDPGSNPALAASLQTDWAGVRTQLYNIIPADTKVIVSSLFGVEAR